MTEIEELKSRLAKSEEEATKLKAALAPFAAVSDALQENHDPEAALKRVTLGDCHVAKAALGGSVVDVELVEKWWLHDKERDDKAFMRLAKYLEDNNLQIDESSVDSAIRTIETLRAQVDRYTKSEPGSPGGRVEAMCRFAEKECGHDPFSARPPEMTIIETVQNLRKEVEQWKREEARRRDDLKRTCISWKYYRELARANEPQVKPCERDTVESYDIETFPYPREWELEDSELKRERDEQACESEATHKILKTLLDDLRVAVSGFELEKWLLAHNEPGPPAWSNETRQMIIVEIAGREARNALKALETDANNE